MACVVDGAPVVYCLLKHACRRLLPLYFDQVHAVDAENLPEPGVPTILAFSHSNDLADMLLLLSATEKRYIRFGAASFLFRMTGVMSVVSFIANRIGAVPVVRLQETEGGGTQQAEANRALLERMMDALSRGQCVALAHEGGSRCRVKLNPFKPGAGVFAERVVMQELAEGRPDFSVRIVPAGVVYTHWTLWRSAAMVRYGKPVIVDAARLDRFGITPDIYSDTRNQRHRDLVDDVMNELRGKLASVAYDIPAHAVNEGGRARIADPDKSKILEGDFPALRKGVVAARMALFDSNISRLPRIDIWQDAVVTLAKALQANRDLGNDVCKYHESLVRVGLRDAQVRGRSRAGCCHILCAAIWALVSVLPLLLAAPGAILFSPMLLLAWRKHRATIARSKAMQQFSDANNATSEDVRKALKEQLGREPDVQDMPRDEDIVRRRRNFDLITGRGKGILAVLYFVFLECLFLVLGLFRVGKVAELVHVRKPMACVGVFLLLPSFVYLFFVLSLRALDEACALLRTASGHWALARVANQKLAELRGERERLRREVLDLQGIDEVVARAQETPAGWSNLLFGRSRSDWMEALSLSEDLELSLSGFYEDPPCGVNAREREPHEGYDQLAE